MSWEVSKMTKIRKIKYISKQCSTFKWDVFLPDEGVRIDWLLRGRQPWYNKVRIKNWSKAMKGCHYRWITSGCISLLSHTSKAQQRDKYLISSYFAVLILEITFFLWKSACFTMQWHIKRYSSAATLIMKWEILPPNGVSGPPHHYSLRFHGCGDEWNH